MHHRCKPARLCMKQQAERVKKISTNFFPTKLSSPVAGGKKVGVDVYMKMTSTLCADDFTMNKVAQYAIFVSAVSWWRDAKKYKCTISACPVDKIPKTGATMRGMTEGDGETFVIPDEELGKLAERFSEKWSCTTVCNDDEDDDALNELF
eukprot:scpid88624/ scgid4672/ 